MSFSKISLYSVIFFSCINVSNQIIAMEEITESIKQELSILDQNIIALQKALQPAEEQMNKDEKQLNDCMEQREKTKKDGTFFNPDPKYTMNCKALERAYGYSYSVNEYEYNGRIRNHGFGSKTIHLSKNFSSHCTLKRLLTQEGSLGRYNGIILSIKKDKRDYNQFQDDLARGIRVNDLAYLQLLKEKIQANNQEVKQRNSCLSSKS